MADTSNLTTLLIGAALGIVGSAVTQIIGLSSGWIDRKHQTRLRRKERLEKLVGLLSESLVWYKALLKCKTIEEYAEAQPPSCIRLLVMNATLSFPKIVGPAGEWAKVCLEYYGRVGDAFDPKVPATMGAQFVLALRHNPALRQFDEKVHIVRNQLDAAIAEEGRNYLDV